MAARTVSISPASLKFIEANNEDNEQQQPVQIMVVDPPTQRDTTKAFGKHIELENPCERNRKYCTLSCGFWTSTILFGSTLLLGFWATIYYGINSDTWFSALDVQTIHTSNYTSNGQITFTYNVIYDEDGNIARKVEPIWNSIYICIVIIIFGHFCGLLSIYTLRGALVFICCVIIGVVPWIGMKSYGMSSAVPIFNLMPLCFGAFGFGIFLYSAKIDRTGDGHEPRRPSES